MHKRNIFCSQPIQTIYYDTCHVKSDYSINRLPGDVYMLQGSGTVTCNITTHLGTCTGFDWTVWGADGVSGITINSAKGTLSINNIAGLRIGDVDWIVGEMDGAASIISMEFPLRTDADYSIVITVK